MSLAPHDCSAWVLNAKQRREVFWLFDTYLFEEVDKRVQQIGVHEALSHFKISLRLLVQSRHTKKFDDTFFMTHESTREMRSMPARPMWLWAVSATPHLVHDVPVTACFWRQVNHSSREKRCSYMIQFLWEMAVFLFVRNIFLCNLHHHPSTHPPTHPSSISETRRSRRYQRVSFHESHHQRRLPGFHGNSPLQGRRSEEACVIMLRVTMETGATAYISIHCASVTPSHIPPYN